MRTTSKSKAGSVSHIEFLKDGIGWVNLRPYAVLSLPAPKPDAYSIELSQSKSGRGLVVRATLRNNSNKGLRLRALSLGQRYCRSLSAAGDALP